MVLAAPELMRTVAGREVEEVQDRVEVEADRRPASDQGSPFLMHVDTHGMHSVCVVHTQHTRAHARTRSRCLTLCASVQKEVRDPDMHQRMKIIINNKKKQLLFNNGKL